MTILITGASGLIGTALINRLRESENLIVCQSREARTDEPGVKWIKHNLTTDSWGCLDSYDIHAIYHLAGQTSIYGARKSPIADINANVIALLTLIEYFREHEFRPFIVVAGTATEVGLTDQLPINESMTEHPVSFYDLSKLTAEMYLKQYIREGFAHGCALRLSNVFGRSSPGQQKDRGILDKIFAAASAGNKITIYGDGNYLRDYIFIDDVVEAFVAALKNSTRTNGKSFYIGSGQGTILKDAFLTVAALAAKIVRKEVIYENVSPPDELSPIEFRNAVIDNSAFRLATGWSPKYSFDVGVEAAYADYSAIQKSH
jgi:nucleoside-diphosphate-sugar epimerase